MKFIKQSNENFQSHRRDFVQDVSDSENEANGLNRIEQYEKDVNRKRKLLKEMMMDLFQIKSNTLSLDDVSKIHDVLKIMIQNCKEVKCEIDMTYNEILQMKNICHQTLREFYRQYKIEYETLKFLCTQLLNDLYNKLYSLDKFTESSSQQSFHRLQIENLQKTEMKNQRFLHVEKNILIEKDCQMCLKINRLVTALQHISFNHSIPPNYEVCQKRAKEILEAMSRIELQMQNNHTDEESSKKAGTLFTNFHYCMGLVERYIERLKEINQAKKIKNIAEKKQVHIQTDHQESIVVNHQEEKIHFEENRTKINKTRPDLRLNNIKENKNFCTSLEDVFITLNFIRFVAINDDFSVKKILNNLNIWREYSLTKMTSNQKYKTDSENILNMHTLKIFPSNLLNWSGAVDILEKTHMIVSQSHILWKRYEKLYTRLKLHISHDRFIIRKHIKSQKIMPKHFINSYYHYYNDLREMKTIIRALKNYLIRDSYFIVLCTFRDIKLDLDEYSKNLQLK